jgi:hypothetical protein
MLRRFILTALVVSVLSLGLHAQCPSVCPLAEGLLCDGTTNTKCPFPGGPTSYVQALPELGLFPNCVQNYRLYLPEGLKPISGWPVLIHLDMTGSYKTVDFPCLNPTATGTQPFTFDAYNQRRLAKIRDSGIAVITARATPSLPEGSGLWTSLCPCTTAELHPGSGLFHPPNAMSMVGGSPKETYQDLTYANAEKDGVMLIQHVRYWAQQMEDGTPSTVTEALSLLDDQNIIVDGSSAGANALMWTVVGPDRGLALPFFGHGGQYDVSSKPKAAILRNGLIWPPIMSECNDNLDDNVPHYGCDEGGECCALDRLPCSESYIGFGSSATIGATSGVYADSRELMQSSVLWNSIGQPEIPIYMRYEQDFKCVDYSMNGTFTLPKLGLCAAASYAFSFTGMGQEDHVHPSWSGYTWKYLHGDSTRLVINGKDAYLKKDVPQTPAADFDDVLGLIFPQPENTTPQQEDECTKDQIIWLHSIIGTPALDQQAWVRIDWGPSSPNPVPVAISGVLGYAPRLTATGTCIPPNLPQHPVGSPYEIHVTHAAASANGYLVVGVKEKFTSVRGGYLITEIVTTVPFMTNGAGEWTIAGTWPDLDPGTYTFYQAWIADSGPPNGYASSNGLLSVTQLPEQ